MSLPFQIDYEPPRLADLRAAARNRWVWATLGLAVLATAGLFLYARWRAGPPEAGGAVLVVTSAPAGAVVEVDGRPAGTTPASLTLAAGDHRVRLRLEGRAESDDGVTLHDGQSVALSRELWLREPSAKRLRPTFPGASIADAGYLADGRVVLTVTIPPGNERQVWLLDEAGGTERLGPPEAPAGLAVTAAGDRFAYLSPARGARGLGAGGWPTEVWVGAAGEAGRRVYELAPEAADERLVDLAWAPDGQHLLAATRLTPVGGGQRTRLLWIDPGAGAADELVTLPSEVVPGSYAWSPGGGHVALLTRVGQLTSLCLLAVPSGGFRYLADLSRDDASPLPFAPVGWSPDGRQLVYSAPVDDRPRVGGWLFGGGPTVGLFTAALDRPVARRLGDAQGHSPAWRADGTIVALARPKGDRPLVLRAVAPDGAAQEAAQLPVTSPAVYAARWDPARGQAIVAVRGSAALGATRPEFWLLRFAGEAGR